jgi:uncharacterized membrane protein
MVEALTIVLAVGYARSWRVSLGGAFAAFAVLTILTVLFGPLIGNRIPIVAIRLVAGAAALYFGFKWTKKAILRASGRKAQRDEAALFEAELIELRTEKRDDREAFLTSFNGVFLEGIEVVIIVVSLGAATVGGVLPASLGALVAAIAVLILGIILRKPAAAVPENAMKIVVGVMLLSFGTFWVGEAAGIKWPLEDTSLFGLVALYAAIVFGSISALKVKPAA